MLTFPLAAENDAPRVAAIRQRCWSAVYRGIYPNSMIDGFDHAWHAARDLQRIRDPRHIVHLICRDGQPIGYMILLLSDPPLLMSLYLLPEHCRQGAGQAAFRLVRETFRSLGHSAFTCHCLPQNTPARAFYERMGGVVCGADEGNPEPWQDSVIYRFSLVPPATP